uniref:Transmembrane protein 53 (inferred by orthology to a human protein) n=1 Tax=Strongyloides venezuelensis TaxID=75913 RepID=A0A0K0EXD6_STRVS
MDRNSIFEIVEGDSNINNNESNVIICLFGWAGCKDRYLKKYATFYEEAGYSTLRATAPIEKIRNLRDYKKYGLEYFKKFLSQPNVGKKKVFFHIFSMNGASTFLKFYEILLNHEESIMISGIIFDSCPADVKPTQGALAISYALYPPSKYGNLTTKMTKFILTIGFMSHRYMIYLESLFTENAYERNFAYYKLITMNSLPKQQLYLFSEKDNICSSSSIKEFIKKQETINMKTFEKLEFTDSEHVQHFRSYPREYADKCLLFIKSSL